MGIFGKMRHTFATLSRNLMRFSKSDVVGLKAHRYTYKHKNHGVPKILRVGCGGDKMFLAINVQYYVKFDIFCHILLEL